MLFGLRQDNGDRLGILRLCELEVLDGDVKEVVVAWLRVECEVVDMI